jgi:hypothetical protein
MRSRLLTVMAGSDHRIDMGCARMAGGGALRLRGL